MNKEVILQFLPMLANKYLYINALMHLLVFFTVAMIFMPHIKFKKTVFNILILVLMLSISILSIVNGNPFNFLTFFVLSVFAFIEIIKAKNEITTPKISIKTILCLVFILIGMWYPHFVNAHPALLIFLSPVGVLPCPSLYVLLGLLNLYHPQVNKSLFTATALIGLFYGITGVFVLNVALDIPLLILNIYSIYNLRFLLKKNKNAAGIVNMQ